MLTIEQLNEKHPDWSENSEYWSDIDLLYRGGKALKREASRFLFSRPQEPAKVFAARLRRFSYQGVLPTALGWYSTKLFKEPVQFFPRRNEAPITDEGLNKFTANADRKGNTLQDLARGWFVRAALDGSVYVLLDLPGEHSATNRMQQLASGEIDPFLVTYNACQVINWDCDAVGEFNWVIIHTSGPGAAAPGEKRKTIDRWYVFNREEYTIYESTGDGGNRGVSMIAQGPHSMSDQRRVPILKIHFPEELCLANRVYLQVIDLLNEDNALAWKLLMSNLAIPVVIGEPFTEGNTLSESEWLKLPTGSDFKWSEPAGTNFQFSMQRISDLLEEIHRQMHLQAQSRKQGATPAAQSGWSKELEMQPAIDILNGYGEIFRSVFRRILQEVAAVRARKPDPTFTVDVQGLTFQETAIKEIDDATLAAEAVPGSELWRKFVQKRVVDLYAPQMNPTLRAEIFTQIDAAADQPLSMILPPQHLPAGV